VKSRTQLTRFVPEAAATDVEAVCRRLDPTATGTTQLTF
jgi:hypothetical protein